MMSRQSPVGPTSPGRLSPPGISLIFSDEEVEERVVEDNRKQLVADARIEAPKRHELHVEIIVPANCAMSLSEVRKEWYAFLSTDEPVWSGTYLDILSVPQHMRSTMQRLTVVSDTAPKHQALDLDNANLHLHCFVQSEEETVLEELEPTHDGDEFTPACDNLTVPHKSLNGMWDSLVFEASIKSSLLNYAQSALLFSEKGVSSHAVDWNRLILLHGAPGNGKTSLCRALAHKLAIRMSHKFSQGQLLEIKAHSLFSKWFSTSGKLVSRLFDLVQEMVQDDPKTLVCVLLDEVESLACARSQLGGDPADSMRAVNSLLTSLDRLKVFPNVLVLATTNMTAKVDLALVDRCDLKLFVGNPILEARHEILTSSLKELIRVGIVEETDMDDFSPNDQTSLLHQAAMASKGLSGRSLRRLSLQAHALFLPNEPLPISASAYIKAMTQVIDDEHFNTELR